MRVSHTRHVFADGYTVLYDRLCECDWCRALTSYVTAGRTLSEAANLEVKRIHETHEKYVIHPAQQAC